MVFRIFLLFLCIQGISCNLLGMEKAPPLIVKPYNSRKHCPYAHNLHVLNKPSKRRRQPKNPIPVLENQNMVEDAQEYPDSVIDGTFWSQIYNQKPEPKKPKRIKRQLDLDTKRDAISHKIYRSRFMAHHKFEKGELLEVRQFGTVDEKLAIKFLKTLSREEFDSKWSEHLNNEQRQDLAALMATIETKKSLQATSS